MSDVRDDLRELLRRRANELPPHREVPSSLRGRARRRIAFNALGVGLAVVVAAGGALAGIRAFGGPSAPEPGGSPSPSSQQTPSGSGLPACTSAQLRAVGSMEGAAGSREGAITLENLSDQTCTLQGRPVITLLDQSGNPISSGVTISSTPPRWVVDRSPKPPGWPVVTLRQGDSASVRIRWSNWCPNGGVPPLWRMGVPGGGAVEVGGMDALGAPPCNGPGQPSTIEEGPFEPGSGR